MNSLKIYNTFRREKEEFIPLNKDSVRMYVCGPTVYDEPHIGNARPLIIFDLVFRILIKNFGKIKLIILEISLILMTKLFKEQVN